VHAALAPQRQVAVGGDALTEIQRAEILQHLFDDGPMSASLRRHRPQWVDCDVERRLFERDLEWLGGDLALKL